ncbi:peptidase C14 caspase catalytic subunit p20 [Cyanobacterium stanieri PCC 7202]|uniref:Peptidase C14 caspase catalytic subunit p20 n=1 Tax=Cyanobacterium stanieri (strain ATCC 29140 / PCC 7202) TaxID=292563 RepID=K9YQL5_CYASC|nr:peptidase C14 caspase catalytic subunit p20 [Cyanobacterium stanieri PCC 7202]
MVKSKCYRLPITLGLGFVFLLPFSPVQAQSYRNNLFFSHQYSTFQGIENQLIAQRQEQQKRVALVIGNADYRYAGILQNPVNDAEDMAQKLGELGFEVILVTDSSLRAMNEALERFYYQLDEGATGLFYFAGHGIQYNGENYLIPVDAHIRRASEIEFETFALGKVLATMEEAKSDINIVILDACRDNPFARNFRSIIPRGLAPVQINPTGLFIAFATGPGNVAEDGIGRNGTFTAAVLSNLTNENQNLETMFSQVRLEVSQETDSRQIPWTSSSVVGNFYFNGDGSTPTQVATTANVNRDNPRTNQTVQSRDGSNPREDNISEQPLARAGNVNRFTQSPPRLLDFSTPHNIIRHPSPTYYVTLDIPEQSFPALGKVTIEQQPGVENIEFDLGSTEAFFGTRRDRQGAIPITIEQGENSNVIEIYFDSPIGDNNQVTIALKPYRNPNFAGIFQFTTHAFPVGTDTIGMNLGLGRLHFYRRGF